MTRPLGDGSVAVCDARRPTIGGVPGIDPPSFADTPKVSAAINDLSCRFETFIESNASCTVNQYGDFEFLSEGFQGPVLHGGGALVAVPGGRHAGQRPPARHRRQSRSGVPLRRCATSRIRPRRRSRRRPSPPQPHRGDVHDHDSRARSSCSSSAAAFSGCGGCNDNKAPTAPPARPPPTAAAPAAAQPADAPKAAAPAGSDSEVDCFVIVDAEPDFGAPPLNVNFITEIDCTGQPVTYSWDFGDGTKGGNDPKPTPHLREGGRLRGDGDGRPRRTAAPARTRSTSRSIPTSRTDGAPRGAPPRPCPSVSIKRRAGASLRADALPMTRLAPRSFCCALAVPRRRAAISRRQLRRRGRRERPRRDRAHAVRRDASTCQAADVNRDGRPNAADLVAFARGPSVTFIGIASPDGRPAPSLGTLADGTPGLLPQRRLRLPAGRRGDAAAQRRPDRHHRRRLGRGRPESAARLPDRSSTTSSATAAARSATSSACPADAPLDFSPLTQALADTINDLSCRFDVATRANASCTQNGFGQLGFVAATTRAQFCLPVTSGMAFPTGDTEIAVQLRDQSGLVGPVQKMMLRVDNGPFPPTFTPLPPTRHPDADRDRDADADRLAHPHRQQHADRDADPHGHAHRDADPHRHRDAVAVRHRHRARTRRRRRSPSRARARAPRRRRRPTRRPPAAHRRAPAPVRPSPRRRPRRAPPPARRPDSHRDAHADDARRHRRRVRAPRRRRARRRAPARARAPPPSP